MPISFDSIPANYKVPLYYVEIDPSKAGNLDQDLPAVLFGYMNASGTTAVANVPIPVASVAQAWAEFGRGSQLARMFEFFFKGNTEQLTYCVPIAEPGAGVAATGTFTFTGPATGSGVVVLYIAGQTARFAVASSDSVTAMATAAAAAINANGDMPVTASSAVGVVTVTYRHKGIVGNDVQLGHSLGGTLAGEALPPGVGITASVMASGAGDPVLTNALANLGDEDYEYVALGFNDTGSIGSFETEFGFSDSGRWGWKRQKFGHVFGAKRESYANLLTYGAARNSGVVSIAAMESTIRHPFWEVSAAYAAKAARSLSIDPARPLQTLQLEGIVAPPRKDRFLSSQLDALASNGFAIMGANPNGFMHILREQTTYQKNAWGQGDTAYDLVTILATLAKLIRRQRHAITTKFGRHKLANDGTRFGPGQKIVTPNTIRAELVAQARQDEYLGLVENVQEFKNHMIVERMVENPNGVAVLYPPDLINGLRSFNVVAQFRQQYPLPLA